MIPETTRGALAESIQRFDRELRQAPEWSKWPREPGSHRWAIRTDERLYPVKQIISMATGLPTSAFYGGDEANNYAKRYGFEIVLLVSDESATTAESNAT